MTSEPSIHQNNSANLSPSASNVPDHNIVILHSPSNMSVKSKHSKITLPKIISVFGKMPEGKIKKCTYIVEKGSAKNMNMIINEIKILLGLPRNDQSEWKLSDLEGKVITKASDLYLQESATFMLTTADSPEPVIISVGTNSGSKQSPSQQMSLPTKTNSSKSGLATLRTFPINKAGAAEPQPNANPKSGSKQGKDATGGKGVPRRNSSTEIRKLDWVYGKTNASLSNGLIQDKSGKNGSLPSKRASNSNLSLSRKSSKPALPRKSLASQSNRLANAKQSKSLSIDKPVRHVGSRKASNSKPNSTNQPSGSKITKKQKSSNLDPTQESLEESGSCKNEVSKPKPENQDKPDLKNIEEPDSSNSGHLPSPPVIGKPGDEPFYLKLGQPNNEHRKPMAFTSSLFGDKIPQIPTSQYRPESAIPKFYPQPSRREDALSSSSRATFTLNSSFHPSLSSSTLSSFDTEMNASSSDISLPPNPLLQMSTEKLNRESLTPDKPSDHGSTRKTSKLLDEAELGASQHNNKSILKGPDSAQTARRILKAEEAAELLQEQDQKQSPQKNKVKKPEIPADSNPPKPPNFNSKTVRFASRPVTLETIYSTKSQRNGPSLHTKKKPKVYHLPRPKPTGGNKKVNMAAPIGSVKIGFGNFAQPTMASLRKNDQGMTKVDVAG